MGDLLSVTVAVAKTLRGCVVRSQRPGGYRGTSRLYLRALRPAGQPPHSIHRPLRPVAPEAPCGGTGCVQLRPGQGGVDVPYIDINPHRSRPKWWSYLALGLLLVVTSAVVGAALVQG